MILILNKQLGFLSVKTPPETVGGFPLKTPVFDWNWYKIINLEVKNMCKKSLKNIKKSKVHCIIAILSVLSSIALIVLTIMAILKLREKEEDDFDALDESIWGEDISYLATEDDFE